MSKQSISEQVQNQNAQKTAAKNAANRGGLVLGADQAHTFAMSSMLNKINGIDNLTNNNYTSWLKQVSPPPKARQCGLIAMLKHLCKTTCIHHKQN
jgi:hypothetical protein